MINWNTLPGILPATDYCHGMVSKPVLFAVGAEVRAGEYHCNGWFYSKMTDHMDRLGMARGHKDAVKGIVGETQGLPDATARVYLDQVPSPLTQERNDA